MCFHWRELHARKREEKKKKEEETSRQRCVQKERSLGPKRKTNVIVHCAVTPPALPHQLVVGLPTNLSPASLTLPPCFPESLFAQVDSDTVLNEPQSSPHLHAWL